MVSAVRVLDVDDVTLKPSTFSVLYQAYANRN